jgi:hypothetical protein
LRQMQHLLLQFFVTLFLSTLLLFHCTHVLFIILTVLILAGFASLESAHHV